MPTDPDERIRASPAFPDPGTADIEGESPLSVVSSREESSASGHDHPALPPWLSWTLMAALGGGIWLAAAWHESADVPQPRWRLLAVFMPTVLGLMLRPMAGGAIVLLALVAAVVVGALDMKTALAGYADSTVWLVLAAYFMSRAFIKTGLARRVALTFVRVLGRTTLGLSYALVATDALLAALIPSNAARVGGVLLPITRSMAELYRSHPGKSASLLGTFLMLVLYQGDVVACALFLTGQASNPLAAKTAEKLTADHFARQAAEQSPTGEQSPPPRGITLDYATWTWYALLPALTSLLVVPWLTYRLARPEITETPDAADFARRELARMGPMAGEDWMLVAVFLGVCTLWIVKGRFDIFPEMRSSDWTALVALGGAGVLLFSGVLTWEDAISERGAWDVFIWYGGLVQLGLQLQEAGLTVQFAEFVVDHLYALPLVALFIVVLLIYFYAHYGFASITVHLVSMYPAFVGVLLAAGAPPALVVACFAYFANFSAGLTHYGTTPAPIVFSMGYVSLGTWWRIGLLLSLVNVAVWLTVGMLWWKLLGLW